MTIVMKQTYDPGYPVSKPSCPELTQVLLFIAFKICVYW